MQLTQDKLAALQVSLNKAQADLNTQKGLLKASLDQLYEMSDASTLELLIGSDSFTQFINEQTYMETLKNGIQASTEKVIALKQQIQAQQTQEQSYLAEQQSQQASLVSTQDQQQTLLNQTQGQEATYKQVISNLEAQQNVINQEIIATSRVVSISGGSGGYPWANAQPFDGYYSCPGFDPWGMCERSCTSYSAWKVASTDRDMPAWGYGADGANGNAGYWTQDANSMGIPTGTTPRVGAVANWTYGQFGPYGHVAFVEAVNSDGSVLVSEYNFVNPGRYDERLMTPGISAMPDHYIYF
jgi:surface antigen